MYLLKVLFLYRYYFYNTCKETGEMKLNLLFDLHDISLHDLIHQVNKVLTFKFCETR